VWSSNSHRQCETSFGLSPLSDKSHNRHHIGYSRYGSVAAQITSGQSNLTLILHHHCRRTVHMGGHIGATWRIQLNLCFLRPTRVHNPNSKFNRFSCFHTGDLRVSLHFTMGAHFPQNCPFPRGIWTPSNMIPWAHPSPQTKRHLYQFSRFCTDDRRVSLYFTMGHPFPPSKLPLPMGGSGPPSNTWFRGLTCVLNPNGIWISSAVLPKLTSVTDRPTDHATRLVTIECIYVRSTAMLSNNTNNTVSMTYA